jgi:chemotaxis protein methyltransferase CheR
MMLVPTAGQIERFRGIIAARLGLEFEDSKLAMLSELLRRRLEQSGAGESDGYLAQLEGGKHGKELDAICSELTVAETYFFRNLSQFHALSEVALPERVRCRAKEHKLRVLSAGCATGEEAFSIAILLEDAGLDGSWEVSIRAVDVNPAVLARAVRGRFSSWALRETPPELQRKWFHQQGRDFLLDETIRGRVVFEQRNLAGDDPELWQPRAYDVIFCRNVLMYFTDEQARAAVARISRSLAPGGFLFLGHAETLRGLSQDFHLRHTHDAFYYERSGNDAATPLAGSPIKTPRVPATPLNALVEDSASWVGAIHAAAQRIRTLARPPAADADRLQIWDLASALDHLESDRFSEALDSLQALPSRAAADPDVLLLKAALYAHSGDFGEAELAAGRLLELDELNAGAHYVLALCREGVGDRAGAIDHDQTSAYLDGSFAMPRLHLGLMARRAGDRAAARRELGQAMILLQREDSARLLLFGGGFRREALIALCRAQLDTCGLLP